MKYYSQINQDEYYINNIISHKKYGRFLDIGAGVGILESNTYCLEKYFGWSGICVEAQEEISQICAINRPLSTCLCSVIWGSEIEVDFTIPRNGNILLSRINNIKWNKEYFSNDFIDPLIIKRKTNTIKNILGKNNYYFDYFSLDIEGAELEALQGICWDNTEFGFITIEYGNREDYKNSIISFLNSHNYSLHRTNRWDIEFINNKKL